MCVTTVTTWNLVTDCAGSILVLLPIPRINHIFQASIVWYHQNTAEVMAYHHQAYRSWLQLLTYVCSCARTAVVPFIFSAVAAIVAGVVVRDDVVVFFDVV